MPESTAADARTVLLVDDEPQILTTLMRYLALKGYKVEVATSVADAMPVIQERRIDAVILDLRLPVSSGLELLKVIREDENLRSVPVMILTGGTLTRDEQAVLARYQAFVFYKPRSYEALAKYLDRVTATTPPAR